MARGQTRLGIAAFLVCIALPAYAAQGNVTEGETLYKASCSSCHTERPGRIIGKPVEDLVAKMHAVKNMDGAVGKVLAMQNALKPLSDQQLIDIATYLHQIK